MDTDELETKNVEEATLPSPLVLSPEPQKAAIPSEPDKKVIDAQEKIVFSENHNLDDYLIGK